MITKKDILRMVHKVDRQSQGLVDRRLIHPEREWGIGLSIFFLIVILGGTGNAYLYFRYSTVANNLEEPPAQGVVLKEQHIAATLLQYQSRKADFKGQLERFASQAPTQNLEPQVEEVLPSEAGEESATSTGSILPPINGTTTPEGQ